MCTVSFLLQIDWGLTSDDVEDIDFNITIEDVGADQEAPIDFSIEVTENC